MVLLGGYEVDAVRSAGAAAEAIAAIRATGGSPAVVTADLDGVRELSQVISRDEAASVLEAIDETLVALVHHRLETIERTDDEWVIVLAEPDREMLVRELELTATPMVRVGAEFVRLTLSIGVAFDDDPSTRSPDELIGGANAALHRARRIGRGFVIVHDASLQADMAEQHHIEQALPQALRAGELLAYFQPIVRTSDGAVVGAEALVRWEHPERGLLAPGVFLAAAERTGAIVDIGEHILRRALEAVRHWPALADGTPRYVAVNVAGRQLVDASLPGRVQAALDDAGTSHDQLCLEVVEGAAHHELCGGRNALEELREVGCRLAIDDFGTGWSSFERLQSCPVDVLKIDRSFVAGTEYDGVEGVIVDALVGIGRALDVQVVAEGVENAHMLASLVARGVPYVQGYHLGRPQPAADIQARLRSTHRIDDHLGSTR